MPEWQLVPVHSLLLTCLPHAFVILILDRDGAEAVSPTALTYLAEV